MSDERRRWCRDEPGPCIDCGESTLNLDRCRDCDIEYCLDSMQCSVCRKLHTARDELLGPAADSIWGIGHRCECPEPKPPTVYDVNHPGAR